MDIRANDDGQVVAPAGVHNAAPACGELVYGGGTAFTSASNPAAEVIDGTGVAVGGLSLGVTENATNGTLTITRTGDYDVELNLADFSSGTASGNVQFDVQKNGAAFSGTSRMQVIRVAATAKAGVIVKKRQRLKKGDVLRTVVTSAAGAVQTVTEGVLRATQVKDISSKVIVEE